MEKLAVEFTAEEKQKIRILAAKAGFSSMREYVRSEMLKIIEKDESDGKNS